MHALLLPLLFAPALQAKPVPQVVPAAQEAPAFELILEQGRPKPELQGIWLSRGYGWCAEIRPEGSRIFDVSPAGVLQQESDPAQLFVGTSFRMAGSQLQLTGIPGSSSVYTWDRLSALPEGHEHPPGEGARAVFDYFWALMDHHYAYFPERGIDWAARREEHRPRVHADTSEAELWDILCDMLRGFGDDHMSLAGEVDGEEREFSEGYCRELDPALDAAHQERGARTPRRAFWGQWYRQHLARVRNELLEGRAQEGADGQLIWGRIDLIGYIHLAGMGGFSDSEEMHAEVAGVHQLLGRVLTDLADCEGIILDITLNSGGYDPVQMAIASHFTDERRLAFLKRPLDVEGAPLQPFYLVPTAGPRYLGPVSLVTSDYTVSAGEDFTLGMRELPHVTHRGRRTRGAFSDVLEKALPNGWVLSLSNEAYVDVEGNNWEAIGVTPEDDIPIFVSGALEHSHTDAIYAVVDKMMAGE